MLGSTWGYWPASYCIQGCTLGSSTKIVQWSSGTATYCWMELIKLWHKRVSEAGRFFLCIKWAYKEGLYLTLFYYPTQNTVIACNVQDVSAGLRSLCHDTWASRYWRNIWVPEERLQGRLHVIQSESASTFWSGISKSKLLGAAKVWSLHMVFSAFHFTCCCKMRSVTEMSSCAGRSL